MTRRAGLDPTKSEEEEKTMTTYAIMDAHSNEITAGLQGRNARQVAQRIANERGASVWLYEEGAEADSAAEEIIPAGGLA